MIFDYICFMQYKSIRFIISAITSIILLGHTFVPHHHAEEHGHGHLHQHHHEGKGLKNLFSHHCHSTDCFTSIQKYEVAKSVHQQDPAIITPQPRFIVIQSFYRPVNFKYDCNYIYISPHLVNLDFRGPPSQTV